MSAVSNFAPPCSGGGRSVSFSGTAADSKFRSNFALIPRPYQVRWSSIMDRSFPDPPTAVFLHGILGIWKNWGTFAWRLAKEFPTWQFLLVDLRCHGESASIKNRGPHTVASTALDVLKLVGKLRMTPRVLVGHSFGGKVALSMVEQAAKPHDRLKWLSVH